MCRQTGSATLAMTNLTGLIFVLTIILTVALSQLFGFTDAEAEEISRRYSFAEPSWQASPLNADYEIPSIAGLRTIGHPGEPELPVFTARILLPAGEELVSFNVTEGAATTYSNHLVAPAQPEHPLSFTGPYPLREGKDSIYKSSGLFPTALGELASVQSYRGHRIAYINLFPLRTNPVSGEVAFERELLLSVTTRPDAEALAQTQKTFRSGYTTGEWLARNTDNSEMISSYSNAVSSGMIALHSARERTLVDPAETYLYLIITSAALAPIYESLAEDRTRKGLPATVIVVDDIYASYTGVDNQEKIRNFILDAYQNWGSEYVLFGGDINIIPDRDCYVYIIDEGNPMETNDMCCELYYGGLDGTWNDDLDERWGEPEEADLIPDIHIGRVCSDNSTQAQNFIDKLQCYQDAPIVSEIETAGFFGEYLWEETWGGMYMEEIRLGADTWGYTTAGVPFNWNTVNHYEMDGGSWGSDDYINLMNSGNHMMHHLGHSNSGFNAKVYTSDVPSFTANGVTHTHNFGYSQGCMAGEFDNADCIHEMFVNSSSGFVAWIGNTRYGYGVHYTTNGSSQYYHRQFVDALFHEGLNELASANDDSRADNIGYIDYEANRWVHYEVTAFGDPAMPIWTATPSAPVLAHAGVFVLGQTDYTVSVSDGSGPVAGARVCLWDEVGIAYAFGVTNSSGEVTLEITAAAPGTMHLVVSDANLLVTEETFAIIPAGPFVVIDSHSIETEVGNGDGNCDAGETIHPEVVLHNVWNETITGVTATLSSESAYILPSDTVVSYGDIGGDETRAPQSPTFGFVVLPDCPDQTEVDLLVTIRDDDSGIWTGTLTYLISAPVLTISALVLDDSSGGDGDGCLEPGESAAVMVTIGNSGHESATTIETVLASGHTWLEITSNASGTGEILPGGEVVLQPVFSVALDPEAVIPSIINCLLYLDADWEIAAVLEADIAIGGFFDNVESGEGAWMHEVVTPDFVDQWHLSTTRNHTETGASSWKFGSTGTGDYANLADGALVTAPIEIATVTELGFWHWIDAEVSSAHAGKCYDGGLVEVSYNGSTWEVITPDSGYPYTIRAGGTPGPFPEDTPVFSGQSGWVSETFSLETIPGTARFRFRFGSDGSAGGEGWYIDDVCVSSWSATSDVSETEVVFLRPELQMNRPNPFALETRIAFRLPERGAVQLTVHDLQGRLVRTLIDGLQSGGSHHVIWDGRDDAGLAQNTGVYFYRLESGSEQRVRKMTLLR